MTCAVEARHRVRAAAELIRADPQCLGVDVLSPATGPREAFSLEATLAVESVPPGILSALARQRVSVVCIQSQGPDHRQLIAEVAP